MKTVVSSVGIQGGAILVEISDERRDVALPTHDVEIGIARATFRAIFGKDEEADWVLVRYDTSRNSTVDEKVGYAVASVSYLGFEATASTEGEDMNLAFAQAVANACDKIRNEIELILNGEGVANQETEPQQIMTLTLLGNKDWVSKGRTHVSDESILGRDEEGVFLKVSERHYRGKWPVALYCLLRTA